MIFVERNTNNLHNILVIQMLYSIKFKFEIDLYFLTRINYYRVT